MPRASAFPSVDAACRPPSSHPVGHSRAAYRLLDARRSRRSMPIPSSRCGKCRRCSSSSQPAATPGVADSRRALAISSRAGRGPFRLGDQAGGSQRALQARHDGYGPLGAACGRAPPHSPPTSCGCDLAAGRMRQRHASRDRRLKLVAPIHRPVGDGNFPSHPVVDMTIRRLRRAKLLLMGTGWSNWACPWTAPVPASTASGRANEIPAGRAWRARARPMPRSACAPTRKTS